jgi:hypothetical protein
MSKPQEFAGDAAVRLSFPLFLHRILEPRVFEKIKAPRPSFGSEIRSKLSHWYGADVLGYGHFRCL